MKQSELTEQQLKILQEIQELVQIGEQKLQEADEGMAKLEEKWNKRVKAKN